MAPSTLQSAGAALRFIHPVPTCGHFYQRNVGSQQLSANKQVERSSSLATSPGDLVYLTGEISSDTDREQLLWRQFFVDPTLWWDHGQNNDSSRSPEFKDTEFNEVLWLSKFKNPAWMDAQLPAPEMQISTLSILGKVAVLEKEVTPKTVSKLCNQGQLSAAVDALGVLVHTDSRVSPLLFYSVLKRCVASKNLILGRRIHSLTVKMGYHSHTFLCNHILRMYASHGRLQEATDVFMGVAKPDAYMWSSIISAHVKHGQANQAIKLYYEMRKSNVKPDGHVFVAALQACTAASDLQSGSQVHADLLGGSLSPNLFVYNCLVDMYAKCDRLEDARRIFDSLATKDVVTCNVMIAGYARQGMGQKALSLYESMQHEGLTRPDAVTFSGLLQACSSLGVAALHMGKQLHAQIKDLRLEPDVILGNCLVNMYAKCGSLEDARRVFNTLPHRDVVTLTSMMTAYAQQGMGQDALSLYSSLQQEGNISQPDAVTFACLLQGCASVGGAALHQGKQLHTHIEKQGLQTDVVVGTSLVNMYAKCGSILDARSIFDRLPHRDVVTWTAMIAGYAQQGLSQEALNLYKNMQQEGITSPPDAVTFACLLQACASVAALDQGIQLHAQIKEAGLQADVVVGSILVNMYAKCGSMVDAQQVFDGLSTRDIMAWSALIAGYTRHGDCEIVFDLVQRMRDDDMQLNDITFLSLLTACSHAGLVNKGREYFKAMSTDYGITPTVEHYACMVDLLGRAGQLDEAVMMVKAMPFQPNGAVWRTLLGACQKWSNVEVGRQAFDEAVKLDETHASAYVLMSNIYAGAQMWDHAKEIKERRVNSGAWKQPGQSWTDMDGSVHTFVAGDRKHPQSGGKHARLGHCPQNEERG